MPEYNGIGFEEAVLAARPLRPQDYDEARKATWNEGIRAGMKVPPVYPGGLIKPCATCGIEINIGPRQQEVLEQHPKTLLLCLIDAAVYMNQVQQQEPDATYGMVNLGNPYQSKD